MCAITSIKMVVKVKHPSHLGIKQQWEVAISYHRTIVPSVHLRLPSCGWSAPFLHEKQQKTPWPDESSGRGSPLMSSWCIFAVLLLQWSQHVFVFRKWRRSSPQIAAVLPHRRNWFLNVTVEAPCIWNKMSFIAAFICCTMENKGWKYTNNLTSSDESQREFLQPARCAILPLWWLKESGS